MKLKLKSLGIAVLGLALLAPAAALACGGHKGGRHHRGHFGKRGKRAAHFKKMISQLNLDASQKAQLAAMRTQSKAERAALRGQLKAAHKQLRSLMRSQSPSEPAVLAQLQTVNDLRFKLRKLRVTSMMRFRALLNPQQLAQLQQLKKQRRAKWKARRKAWKQRFNKKQQGGAIEQTM